MRICQSWPGSSAAGLPMLTPAMGPATDGLNGLELLLTSHPAAETAATTTATIQLARIFIPTPRRPRTQKEPDHRLLRNQAHFQATLGLSADVAFEFMCGES